ncbi:MAG: hypothetical protein ACK42I_00755 [Thermomicrobium sp.]
MLLAATLSALYPDGLGRGLVPDSKGVYYVLGEKGVLALTAPAAPSRWVARGSYHNLTRDDGVVAPQQE